MSFDLYFVAPSQAGSDSPDLASGGLTEAGRTQWQRITAQLRELMSDLEVQDGRDQVRLAGASGAIGIDWSSERLHLVVPYWFTDEDQARTVTALLYRVVEIVENETALSSWDDQAKAEFSEDQLPQVAADILERSRIAADMVARRQSNGEPLPEGAEPGAHESGPISEVFR
ncbi:hypothetical protein [Parenemella sanctibonifatiensis]|uniref:Uncharacterized protein n=1 Tax=Parenemella sanctibonifatiensis TaxID=2016505 RepID=A0A255EB62_9ACTN|nr:hypothetical protein [Parenemella sanctibonifatiensis]OYN88589.1 hypothetical protein CGZ91_13345 [Parenemella sanctibonifatiensis]OYN88798.1 hypothetical protein CGZ92_03585 [Parenemella sanctibonifatiensis]